VIILSSGPDTLTAGFVGVSFEGTVIATAWLVDRPTGTLVRSCSQETVAVGCGSTLLSLSLNAFSAICLGRGEKVFIHKYTFFQLQLNYKDKTNFLVSIKTAKKSTELGKNMI
jgi:hypothetical protein